MPPRSISPSWARFAVAALLGVSSPDDGDRCVIAVVTPLIQRDVAFPDPATRA